MEFATRARRLFRGGPNPANEKASVVKGRVYRMPSESGQRTLREEHCVTSGNRSTARVRCVRNHEDFDLRILRAASGSCGAISTSALEALEREAALFGDVPPQSHVVHCHASHAEKVRGVHFQLMLCDPCIGDLAAHLAQMGGSLSSNESRELGEQLAFGLGHLHIQGILCGDLTARGVLKGRDGYWKLGDFGSATKLPVTAGIWRRHRIDNRAGSAMKDDDRMRTSIAPEARTGLDVSLTPAFDIWYLGRLLQSTLPKDASSCVADTHVVPLCFLLDPQSALLWLMLHWLLADDAESRPDAKIVASLLGCLSMILPHELLEDIPSMPRIKCLQEAAHVAKRLALSQLCDAPLQESMTVPPGHSIPSQDNCRHQEGKDLVGLDVTADVRQLCKNCGIDADSLFHGSNVGLSLPDSNSGDISTDADSQSEDSLETSSNGSSGGL